MISLVLDFAGDLASTSGALVDLLRVVELMERESHLEGRPWCQFVYSIGVVSI